MKKSEIAQMNSSLGEVSNGILEVKEGRVTFEELETLMNKLKKEKQKKDAETYSNLLKDSIETIREFAEDDREDIDMQMFFMPISEFEELRTIIFEMLIEAEDYDLEPSKSEKDMFYNIAPSILMNGYIWAEMTLRIEGKDVVFYIPEILCSINMKDVLFFTMKMWDAMRTSNMEMANKGHQLLSVLKNIETDIKKQNKAIGEATNNCEEFDF